MGGKKRDKRNIHISSELYLIYVSSNNDRHPVLRPSLHFATLVDTSLLPIWNFTQLHFAILHCACRHFTSTHLKLHPTTLHYTCRHFTFPI